MVVRAWSKDMLKELDFLHEAGLVPHKLSFSTFFNLRVHQIERAPPMPPTHVGNTVGKTLWTLGHPKEKFQMSAMDV